MCNTCTKEVIEQGIKESDLPYLPYTKVKWRCIVPGCKGGCMMRDYGNDPYYFDIAKVRIKDGHVRRGGWWDLSGHWYYCGRHWKDAQRIKKMMEHRFCAEFFLSKVVRVGE